MKQKADWKENEMEILEIRNMVVEIKILTK